METSYNLPESLQEDLDRFRQMVRGYEDGSVSAVEFRSFRVPQGVYEQREDDTYMLRVRLPAGGILPHQMRALAAVARTYGSGVLHVTTRQDIQVHRVLLENVHPALAELRKAGLSTKGGGGNTVRNITACQDSGVCKNEVFDVTPLALAVTEFMLPDPHNYQLPRKYKIAFSGCANDCAGATVNDLGFVAKRRGYEEGFAVYVGGGMGRRSRVADLLEEFIPSDEVHLVAEAVKRVFDRHGNRKDKHKARLRFLIEKIGLDQFRNLYEGMCAELRNEGVAELNIREFPGRDYRISASETILADGFEEWRRRNVVPQKQDGYHLVNIALDLGDINTDTMERLADLIEVYGEGMLRATQSQNLVIRWVHASELDAVHQGLLNLGLAATPAAVLRNVVACAGAAMCRLGICRSRGLASAVIDALERDGNDLDDLDALAIHISGCPNSCGRHPIAQIGLYGAARRVGDGLVPHYVVQLGGRVAEGMTRLAEGKKPVPARNVPRVVVEILRAFRESQEYPDFNLFLDTVGRESADELIAKYKLGPAFEENENCYFDWGAEVPFSLAGRGPGECSAGVFDLIEVDIAGARDAVRAGDLYRAAVLAARALLVTQGHEAENDYHALDLFTQHFINAGLVSDSYRSLVDAAQQCAAADNDPDAFKAETDEVAALVDAVQDLYDNMDPSLRFRPVGSKQPSNTNRTPEIDREADFGGVACPLNYVKTKLLLEQMASGQVLSVLLDEEGGQNVPKSVEQDGHDVLSVDQKGEQWRVCIRKS